MRFLIDENLTSHGERMPRLCGQIVTDFSQSQLLHELIRHGMVVETRESSHYLEGHYIEVHGDAAISIERVDDKVFWIGGDADDPRTLIQDAQALSLALSNIGLRHRLEVYDNESHSLGYCHWSWPQDTPVASTTAM